MLRLVWQPSRDLTLYALVRLTLTNLLENLCSHMVTAVKDDAELAASLHFFKKGSHVLCVKRQLTDL